MQYISHDSQRYHPKVMKFNKDLSMLVRYCTTMLVGLGGLCTRYLLW